MALTRVGVGVCATVFALLANLTNSGCASVYSIYDVADKHTDSGAVQQIELDKQREAPLGIHIKFNVCARNKPLEPCRMEQEADVRSFPLALAYMASQAAMAGPGWDLRGEIYDPVAYERAQKILERQKELGKVNHLETTPKFNYGVAIRCSYDYHPEKMAALATPVLFPDSPAVSEACKWFGNVDPRTGNYKVPVY